MYQTQYVPLKVENMINIKRGSSNFYYITLCDLFKPKGGLYFKQLRRMIIVVAEPGWFTGS